MKKSKLLLALAVSAMLINSAYASEMKDQKVNVIEEEDATSNPKVAQYKVKTIYEDGVDIVDVNNEADVYNVPKSYFKGMDLKEGKIFTLYTNWDILESDPAKFGKVYKVIEGKESHISSHVYVIKTINDQSIDVYEQSNQDDLYSVPKKEFKDIELKEGKKVEIVADDTVFASYPAQFTKIYDIIESRDEPEEKLVRDFIVKEIYEEGVTLYEAGNVSNLYNVPKSEFKGMKIEKGKVFTITSDSTATKSYPAQFGKIFSIVEKKEMKKPAKTMVKSYVVEHLSDVLVTVHEKDNKESRYTLPRKDFGKINPEVGKTYKIETSEEILTSEPAEFAAVYKVELEKETPKKNEKPADKKKPAKGSKENKKEAEKTIFDIFVVEKIDEEGVTVARKSNKEDKYLVPKKDFGKLEIKEGKEYKIFTDDIVLTSYPAQFGKIYKIEEVMAGKNKNPATNPKTGLIGTSLALVGLIGAGLGYKKIK
ncbi:hypothetical protein [Anaerococcus lactolyticus]|uniref:hypothetical protein n=1 Tax=Anaerococcus lactolyticus TaxID=33032 RepID=UPI0023F41015|nr:hypothetical protein [Anaerococcus lactolyticus]